MSSTTLRFEDLQLLLSLTNSLNKLGTLVGRTVKMSVLINPSPHCKLRPIAFRRNEMQASMLPLALVCIILNVS